MLDDAQLKTAVLAELSWDPSVSAAHIGVTAADGVVTLTGYVDRFAEKHAAETAACRVKGVKAVCEEIVVRLPLNYEGDDDQIACEALSRLAWHAVDPDFAVALKVEKGRIVLTGRVAWQFQKDGAEADLRRIQGVVGIENGIEITPKVSVSTIREDIVHALHRSWFFDPKTIDVTAIDGVVRLTGTVQSPHERQRAAATAWSGKGVIDVRNDLSVA